MHGEEGKRQGRIWEGRQPERGESRAEVLVEEMWLLVNVR